MQPETLLLRQVNRTFLKPDGTVASVAFWPFPKDSGLLSVDDGSRITAEVSWRAFASRPNCSSSGVWAVQVQECGAVGLPARADPVEGNEFHAVVDFTAHEVKRQKALAKVLAARAGERGCLFKAPEQGSSPDASAPVG